MRPRRCFSPLESSPGTSPRYAINAGAVAKRRKSCNSARISIAVSVSMPRKQRNHPTGSRYGSRSAISASRASNSTNRASMLIDRQQIVVNDGTLGGVCPFEAVDPLPVRAGPVAAGVVPSTPQQQLAQPMAAPLQIFARIIPCARQVANRLVFRSRRLNRRQ